MALALKWDHEFESAFLQRTVVSEPGPRGCAVLKLYAPARRARPLQLRAPLNRGS